MEEKREGDCLRNLAQRKIIKKKKEAKEKTENVEGKKKVLLSTV